MNWLMYIGGGIIWYGLWNTLLDKAPEFKTGNWIFRISTMMAWIWICWRFFSEINTMPVLI